jgi:hypothetical protein
MDVLIVEVPHMCGSIRRRRWVGSVGDAPEQEACHGEADHSLGDVEAGPRSRARGGA